MITQNTHKNAEKQGHPYIAGGNIKLYSHSGNGDSSFYKTKYASGCIKLENFGVLKDTINRMKRQPTE